MPDFLVNNPLEYSSNNDVKYVLMSFICNMYNPNEKDDK